MPKLLVIAAVSLVPLATFADDAPVPAPPPSVQVNIYNNAPAPAPVVAPVEPEIVAAPGAVEPVLAPTPPVDADPCARGWWRYSASKRRGFLGVGIAKGHMALDDETEGKQKALIVRAQGRRGFGLELELARGQFGDDTSRSAGGSLFKAFGKRRLMPYVLVGGGRGEIMRATGGEDRMRYVEAGGGLMIKLRRFAIGVDVRRGSRRVDERVEVAVPAMDTAASVVVPTDDHDRERYVRGRVMALVTF
jgi:hypothetical protein